MENHIFNFESKTLTDRGYLLPNYQLAYTTYGKLNASRSNVVWVVHALTGNSHPHLWWPNLFGKGKFLDPDKHFIICANCLGSPYGSTSPLSINPKTKLPYYYDFPSLTIHDLVLAYRQLARHLKIDKIDTLIGASMGGQQALQWAIDAPKMFKNLVLVATNAVHSAFGKAFNAAQRMAIETDPTWGDKTANAGLMGMQTARAIAMLSYRSYNGFSEQQDNGYNEHHRKVESYLRYQGNKLSKRFNAISYWLLTKSMDSHNIRKYQISETTALQKIRAKTLVVGVESDQLFPISEQYFLNQHIPNSRLEILQSDYGHDGFFIKAN